MLVNLGLHCSVANLFKFIYVLLYLLFLFLILTSEKSK